MQLDRSSTAVLALHWLNDIVAADGRFGATFHPMVEATGDHHSDPDERLRIAMARQ